VKIVGHLLEVREPLKNANAPHGKFYQTIKTSNNGSGYIKTHY